MPEVRADAVERILAPLDLPSFLGTYWERSPLHVERDEATRFATLLSVARLERLLANVELRFPDVQLARADDPVAVEDYTDEDDRIVPLRLARLHASGATLVVAGADRHVDELGELCRELRAALGMRCQANAYLSPPASRGFGPHHDSHDVIILQVEGRKTFRFHAGGPELPLARDRFDRARDQAGAIGEEITLAPGDTLYIPRGVMHDALASASEKSLHVTLGLYPLTVLDVLHETLDLAASREISLRRSVGGPRLSRPRVGERAGDGGARDGGEDAGQGVGPDTGHGEFAGDAVLLDLGPLLERVFSAAGVDDALARLRDDVAIGSRPAGQGLLSDDPDAAEPTLDDWIAPAESAPRRAERRDGRLVLSLPGQVLEFREPAASAVEALLRAGRLRVGDLPGPDDERRLALARRLLRERVATTVHP